MKHSPSGERIVPEMRTLSPPAVSMLHTAIDEIYHASIESGIVDLSHPEMVSWINQGAQALPPEVLDGVLSPTSLAGAAILASESIPILPTQSLGPTPLSWQDARDQSLNIDRSIKHPSVLKASITMVKLARAAGEPYGWKGQQFGQLVNNVLPVPGEETENSGASSTSPLTPHSEDAFHPERADELILGSLRNHGVGTTISSLRAVELTPEQEALLTTPTCPILPDVSYGKGSDKKYASVPVATFTHDSKGRRDHLRFDPDYTPLHDASPEFQNAYHYLTQELARVAFTVSLEPGKLLLLNNRRVAHGRVPFEARYDGWDRWLLRVNIRNLPKPKGEEHGYGQKTVRPFA